MTNTNYAVKGTDLQIQAASTGSFVTLGQLQKTDAPAIHVSKRDTTNLMSAAKEYAPGIGDPQEFSGTLVYNPSDPSTALIQVRTGAPAATLDTIKVIFPTTTKFFQAAGFFTAFDPKGGGVDDTWLADFSFQTSGAITYPTT